MQKKELMKKVWGHFKAKNKVVRDCMEDETTFHKEFKKLLGAYNSSKIYAPYSLPEGFNEKLVDLEECVGNSPVKEGIGTKINNPVGASAIGVLSMAGIAAAVDAKKYWKNKEKMNRREFLVEGIIVLGVGIVVGGAIGGLNASFKQGHLGIIEYSAKYLDNIYVNYIR